MRLLFCATIVIVAIFSTHTSTRPSYRARFLISSFLKTILLLKMSSGKFISFRRSVNSVRQRQYVPYLLIPKQHYQLCLRSKVGAPVSWDSPHHRTSAEQQILERSRIRTLCASGNIEFIRSVNTKPVGAEALNPFNKR